MTFEMLMREPRAHKSSFVSVPHHEVSLDLQERREIGHWPTGRLFGAL